MRRISITEFIQVAVFLLLASAYYLWTWSDNLRDLGGDSAIYLLTAQYYSPWSAHSDVAADFARASSYPPLFPLLLGGAGLGGNVAVAHAVTTSFLLSVVLLFYVWLRALRQSQLAAGMSALVFMLLPGTYAQALSILSENLYLLCTLFALVAVAHFETERDVRWLWAAVVGVALSMLTRSAGMAVYLAFLAYLIVWGAPQRWRLGFAALLPFVLWQVLHGLNQPGYISSFAGKYAADGWSAILAQLHVQMVAVGSGWLENFVTNSVGVPVAVIIGAACLAGMVRRLYQRQFDGFYVLAYLLLVVLWPFPAESKRLVFPILPVLLVQGVVLMTKLPEVIIAKRQFKVAYLLFFGSILLIIFPAALLTATQFVGGGAGDRGFINVARAGILPDNRLVWGSETYAVENDLRKLHVQFHDKDCIYSIKPSIVSFYTSVKSILPPAAEVGADQFRRMTAESGCRFYYVMAFVSPTYKESLYPLDRLVAHQIRFDSVVTVQVGGNQRVFSGMVERLN
jgi:hypothetical protein